MVIWPYSYLASNHLIIKDTNAITIHMLLCCSVITVIAATNDSRNINIASWNGN